MEDNTEDMQDEYTLFTFGIIGIIGIIFITLVIVGMTIIFIHQDIAKHEENKTMLEKYRIEMQYLGESKGE